MICPFCLRLFPSGHLSAYRLNSADLAYVIVHEQAHIKRLDHWWKPLVFGEVGVKERMKHVMNYKKPAFWVIIASVVTCIVVAVCFLTNPKDSDSKRIDPFGKYYKVRDIIYESGAYAFSYTTETTPKYYVTNEKELLVLEDKSSTSWLNAGTFEEVGLTKDNFDRYFRGVRGSASSLRSIIKKPGVCW